MANTKSAIKRSRQSLKRRSRNRSNRSRLRTRIRRFQETLESEKNPESVRADLSRTVSLIDKLVRKKILHRNTAARKKSLLTRRANQAIGAAGSS